MLPPRHAESGHPDYWKHGRGTILGREHFHVRLGGHPLQVLWCKCGASLAGADRWRTDAKRHASCADLHLKKRTSNDRPTPWLSHPASARRRHRYSGTDAPHSARRFHRGHRRSRRPVLLSRRLPVEGRSLGRSNTALLSASSLSLARWLSPAAHPSFASRSDCRAWVPYSKSSKSLFPDGKLLSATPWPTPSASRLGKRHS